MTQPNRGLVQSIHARIVNHAKGLGVEPTLMFSRYGLERFLYRLSKTQYAERFVLKGALLLTTRKLRSRRSSTPWSSSEKRIAA